jgi:predicted AAA+ superfamily ATPase
MNTYHRTYITALQQVLDNDNVMLFLMGARQVGKTTLSQLIALAYKQKAYFNWDVEEHRQQILSGQKFIEHIFPIHRIGPKPLIIFDELHKYRLWKNYLKGFYDLYKNDYHIIVTGSAHLNIFQQGGDSLMGRYFPFTIHPFSLGEINPNPTVALFRKPYEVSMADVETLYEFGGFPVPFLKRDKATYQRWKRTRRAQLFREDIRDLTHIHEISQLELCAEILSYQSGQILNRSSLANKLQVSIQTIGRWIETLQQFYYAFTISPWSTNIPHSLVKEPKIYLTDWSLITDAGARFENLVACHLKKTVDFWNEQGQGEFGLYFLRDKRQREVDFLITKGQRPWMLVEAKTSEQPIAASMYYYQEKTKVPYAFQVTKEMPYADYNCFSKEGMFIVPAKTFLSQLI